MCVAEAQASKKTFILNKLYKFRDVELIRLGYDLNRIVKRVAVICEMDPDDIFSKSKQRKQVKARSLLCFWAVRELGISLREMAGHLGISVPEWILGGEGEGHCAG